MKTFSTIRIALVSLLLSVSSACESWIRHAPPAHGNPWKLLHRFL